MKWATAVDRALCSRRATRRRRRVCRRIVKARDSYDAGVEQARAAGMRAEDLFQARETKGAARFLLGLGDLCLRRPTKAARYARRKLQG